MTVVSRIAGAAAALGAALLLGSGLSAPPAWAGYVVTLKEVGSDVVATGSGPLDLTGLEPSGVNFSTAAIIPPGFINTGPANSTGFNQYSGTSGPVGQFNGPESFGSGFTEHDADSGSGDLVGIFATFSILVPGGYVSNNPLSDTSTYLNQTFSSLGVTPGTYVWSWGTGPNQNFTLHIGLLGAPGPIPGPVSVTEPASALLLGAALAGLLLAGAIRCVRHP